MKSTALLTAFLLAACGELVVPDTYEANRHIGPDGGTVSLERLTITIPRDTLSQGLTFRVETVYQGGLPFGALGPVYRVLPEKLPEDLAAAGLDLTYRFDMEELPPEVYFVELSLARLEGGFWIPLDAPEWDPVAGEVHGVSPVSGIFTLVHEPPQTP